MGSYLHVLYIHTYICTLHSGRGNDSALIIMNIKISQLTPRYFDQQVEQSLARLFL